MDYVKILSWHSSGGTEKTTKTSAGTVGVQAKIRTGHHQSVTTT